MSKLSIRPLKEEDISSILSYWFDKSDEDLIQMGVNKPKLGTRESFSQSLKSSLNTPLESAKYFYMIWLIDDQAVGYSSLKDIEMGELATMHLHIWSSEFRGKGYGAELFCMSAVEFYKMFKLKLILSEPKAANPTPNKMLLKIGFKPWRTCMAAFSDIALLSEFNSYIVDLDVAENFLKNKKMGVSHG